MKNLFMIATAALSLCRCEVDQKVVGSADTGVTSDGAATNTGPWTNRTQGTAVSGQHWTAIASSADGDRLFATSTIVIPPINITSGFWTSSNGGQSWTAQTGPAGLQSAASNSTGTVLVASEGVGTSGGGIWLSTTSGATWNESPSSALQNSWGAVASDSTGSHLVAGANSGDIWISSDLGATWSDQTPSGPAHGKFWVSIASDSAGTNWVAVEGGGLISAGAGSAGDIWTSSDSGATWTDQTSSGPAHNRYWASVASDATGTKLVAVGLGIWTSLDAGRTWTEQHTGDWLSVASDASGTHLIAASGNYISNGDLWTSSDSGVTWTNQTAGTSAANKVWMSVASNAAGTHVAAVERVGDIWTN